MFLNIDLDSMNLEDARERLQRFVDRLQQLNRESEIPSDRAWQRAKKQIEGGSQTYETEK